MIASGHLAPPGAAVTAFDRIGGFDLLARAVGRFIGRLAEVPGLVRFAATAGREENRWRLQLLVTDLMGGPMAYDGPDPAVLRHTLALDAATFEAAVALLAACCVEVGAPSVAVTELSSTLRGFGAKLGLTETGGSAGAGAGLIPRAVALVDARQLDSWNLFVLDPQFTVVHLSPEAARAAQAVDPDLRRVFGLRAADLPGTSLLRFHPAPTQLQGMLADRERLPRETTWSFGRATWKAHLLAVEDSAGALLGYAIAWRDESDAHRAEEIFRRLRAEAEDLPVPLMYPDPTGEVWHGNAACEVALARLAPHLPHPVNPLEGVPASLFFPDAAERRALFRDPERLPHKRQIRMGPETVSILVSPVRDQDQRFVGPQITWEIVYFTPPSEPSLAAEATPPVELAVPVPTLSPPESSAPMSLPIDPVPGAAPVEAVPPTQVVWLQQQARAIESAGRNLQQLAGLLDAVALLTAQGIDDATAAGDGPRVDTDIVAREVDAAREALTLARQAGGGQQPGVGEALDALDRLARETNLLAVQAAADVLREDAEAATVALANAVDALNRGLADQIAGVTSVAQGAANTLHAAGIRTSRVRALRAVLHERESLGASLTAPAAE